VSTLRDPDAISCEFSVGVMGKDNAALSLAANDNTTPIRAALQTAMNRINNI